MTVHVEELPDDTVVGEVTTESSIWEPKSPVVTAVEDLCDGEKAANTLQALTLNASPLKRKHDPCSSTDAHLPKSRRTSLSL